jgi:hypothetical protein
VPLSVGFDPDGIAFKATAPKFVVSNNGDGTITRYDFPGDDYTQTPTQSLLAAGGFRGDLSQVGPDGCLYVTQAGTRFDDGTVGSTNSLVRICSGFAPPPGAGTEGPPGDPTCSDSIDNDGDGDVDGDDSDCQSPNEDPDCSGVSADPKLLWPPNHKFQLITLNGATDPDGDPVTLAITSVTQDEPLNGLGDGDTAPDAKAGPAPNKVYVRAERSGTGDGRVYRIAFTVTDGNGGSCTGSATVGVPHDQGKGSTPTDSGLTVNSFGP